MSEKLGGGVTSDVDVMPKQKLAARADRQKNMLAAWHPGDKAELYRRLPKLEAHAKIISARPAVAKVEADHAHPH